MLANRLRSRHKSMFGILGAGSEERYKYIAFFPLQGRQAQIGFHFVNDFAQIGKLREQ